MIRGKLIAFLHADEYIRCKFEHMNISDVLVFDELCTIKISKIRGKYNLLEVKRKIAHLRKLLLQP